MKLPSLNYLVKNAAVALLRFPLSLLAGFLGAGIAIYMSEMNDEITNFFPYINLLLTFALGIPLFFCMTVFSDAIELAQTKRLLLYGFGLLLLTVIYFSFPNFDSTQNISVPYVRYAIYNVAIHLLVAFIPFAFSGQLNGFWHYNKILFVRILTSLLYSGVLFAGLSAALGSLDFLFDIDVHEELYLDLFIFIGGVFNTWFFLAGIPRDFKSLDDEQDYPKALKIFSQYVLLSLLALYLVILYLYAAKIIILWSWPKGIVSYLIVAVSVLGILTLLLVHPYGNLPGNAWIKKISRGYYFVLLPLIILLFIAIGMRVSDYGITINRYSILLLGIWLAIVSGYFISGKQNIKFIPISLSLMLIVVSFGYWGIFSVSERSQVQRLRTILEQGNILKDGRIQQEVMWVRDSLPKQMFAHQEDTNGEKLSDSLHNEVKSILDYLDDHHGFTALRGWFSQDLDSMVKINNEDRWYRTSESQVYMRSMGLPYREKYAVVDERAYYRYNSDNAGIFKVKDFDYVIDLDMDNYNGFLVDSIHCNFVFPQSWQTDAWLVFDQDSMKFELAGLINKLEEKYGKEGEVEVNQEDLIITSSTSRMEAQLQMSVLALYAEKTDSVEVSHMTGIILLKFKK